MSGTTPRGGWAGLILLLPALCLAADAAAPADTAAAPATPVAAIDDYRQELDRLTARLGPYDPQVGEQLLGLGLVYQRFGRYADAEQALRQSLHVKRVNDGLQTVGQIPVLDRLIETDILAGNWESLDQNYGQLLWVHRRNYGAGDPKLLPVVDQIGRWKLKAYAEHLLKQKPSITLDEAGRLYDDTVDILGKQYGETDPRLVNPLYGSALTNYQLMVELSIRPLSEFKAAGPAYQTVVRMQTVCQQTAAGPRCFSAPQIDSVPNVGRLVQQQDERTFEIRKAYLAAGKALERIVAIHDAHPELPQDSLVKALVHYGDWNLMSGKYQEALSAYKRANQMLVAQSATQDLDAYFGAPKQLPALRLPLPAVDRQVEESKKADYVVATVDVDDHGKPRNVEVVEESNPEDGAIRRKAKARLKEGVYRPRFENGVPVQTTGVRIRFVDQR